MSRRDVPWSCGDAEECVLAINDVLRQEGLITSWVFPDSLFKVVARCAGCRRGNPNPRSCTGWRLTLRGTTALSFNPAEVEGRFVAVSIEGQYDFRRSQPGRWDSWARAPMQTCNSAVLVEDLEGNVITRQHLDLANTGQKGAMWHLQLGGLPGGGRERPPYEWFDVPRWPSHPHDFMLTVELVVYSFWWDTWNRIRETDPWRLWVKRAEDLVLAHYQERLALYWNARTDPDSWLAVQCNQIGGWDPRPR